MILGRKRWLETTTLSPQDARLHWRRQMRHWVLGTEYWLLYFPVSSPPSRRWQAALRIRRESTADTSSTGRAHRWARRVRRQDDYRDLVVVLAGRLQTRSVLAIR